MESITLSAELIKIVSTHNVAVSKIQKKDTKYSVLFSLSLSTDKTWNVAISFDGTSEGLVKSMRTKLDNFPNNNGKYEKFIDLYWDLWEAFGKDEDEGTPVKMLTIENIFSNLF